MTTIIIEYLRSELLRIEVCLHTTIIKDLCADCGADLDQIDISSSSKASIPMIHSVPELKVSAELAKKLGRDDTNRLLKDRKLVLLVDLDQTLIHTTNDNVPNNLKVCSAIYYQHLLQRSHSNFRTFTTSNCMDLTLHGTTPA